jgi:acyl-coenzyme A thioesterase PaaI-like protein
MTDGIFPFAHQPLDDHPGWFSWDWRHTETYNQSLGLMMVRRGGDGVADSIARVRMMPDVRHRNLADAVHGGTMMGFIDVSLFAAMHAFNFGPAAPSVTVELQTHFTGSARLHEWLEARVEIARETGSFLFMRGLVVQGEPGAEDTMASFTAIVKKARVPR